MINNRSGDIYTDKRIFLVRLIHQKTNLVKPTNVL